MSRGPHIAGVLAHAKTLAAAGRHGDAAVIVHGQCEQESDNASLWLLCGQLFWQAGNNDAALGALRRAAVLAPDQSEAHWRLAMVLRERGDHNAVIQSLDTAVRLAPENMDALRMLAGVAYEYGDHVRATRTYSTLLEKFPQDLGICYNLGLARMALGEAPKAIEAFKRAAEIDPDNPEILNSLGHALSRTGDFIAAETNLRKAIGLNPSLAEAHYNLGVILLKATRLAEAESEFRAALEHRPGFASACRAIGDVRYLAGDAEGAELGYREAVAASPEFSSAASNMLLAMLYRSDHSDESLLTRHREWARRFAPSLTSGVRVKKEDPNRPLRVGYVSPDFRTHSVACFIEALFDFHDRNLFSIYCYSDVKHPDSDTGRFRVRSDGWRDATMLSTADLTERIAADRIDILVDLAGHTACNRLLVFANRPAPLQVSCIGYPCTTGLDAIDYRLTDVIADPLGQERAFSERLVRLSGGFLCYAPRPNVPDIGPLPALARGHVTFGSLNNLAKTTPEVVGAWSGILRSVPNSRLILKGRGFLDISVIKRYRDQFEGNGISPDRLDLRPPEVTESQHLAVYHDIDIALDTFPYNGTTTTCEALWMGVPVITIAGKNHVARVGASILSFAGLPEFIADDREDFQRKAIMAASDLSSLSSLRAIMRQRVSTSLLCNASLYAKSVENAYRQMWQAYCED
jgi:predicted O-linked N-acetylglucosamine transferase (SPINDLY family)